MFPVQGAIAEYEEHYDIKIVYGNTVNEPHEMSVQEALCSKRTKS